MMYFNLSRDEIERRVKEFEDNLEMDRQKSEIISLNNDCKNIFKTVERELKKLSESNVVGQKGN